MIPFRPLAALFALASLGYVALSYLSFEMPATLAEAELCGFVIDDFDSSGQLAYPPLEAWWISFVRLQEYWVALSLGLSVTFIAFALIIARRPRQGPAAAGAALGGGALAVSALCVSCLAPVLSLVGLGVAGTVLADVPRWLIAANTLMLTGWGTLFLTRRLSSCSLPERPAVATAD